VNVRAKLRVRPSPHQAAWLPQTKSLDTFDFNAQSSLDKALALGLARRERIEKRRTESRLGHPAPARLTPASHCDWLHQA
jgi:hypothetical protein